jgi:hypothetical protein
MTGVALALKARLRHTALDRELASSADPTTSALLAVRARQLTDARTRDGIATSILNVIATADNAAARFSASVPVRWDAVLAAREPLTALAERLRSAGPVWAHGVALASQLILDADSPLYDKRYDLPTAVARAIEALNGCTD